MRCVAVKAEVVSADERESGRRASLNLGHTLGHALRETRLAGQKSQSVGAVAHLLGDAGRQGGGSLGGPTAGEGEGCGGQDDDAPPAIVGE